MTLKKRMLRSLQINAAIYVLFMLLPCSSGSGILNFCMASLTGPFGLIIAFAIQFGILFNFNSALYFNSSLLSETPNFLQFLIFWLIVLSPLYFDKIVIRFRKHQ